jgi:hypothetical protein
VRKSKSLIPMERCRFQDEWRLNSQAHLPQVIRSFRFQKRRNPRVIRAALAESNSSLCRAKIRTIKLINSTCYRRERNLRISNRGAQISNRGTVVAESLEIGSIDEALAL